jgi:DNA replication and repair protein RecF
VFLQSLRLYNFRNYAELHTRLSPRINCLFGKNGSGKTNLLEAIHYLSFTRGAINTADASNIRWGENQFLIGGTFVKQGKQREVVCQFQTGQKKQVKEDDQVCLRLADHIGRFPLVMITPQDIELIWGGGEYRRKFFDTLLSQLDREYLENLIIYNHQLKQRNSLLRKFSETGAIDYELLESYDMPLSHAALIIYQKRLTMVKQMLPRVETQYAFIAGEQAEEASIHYRSDLADGDPMMQWKKNILRDVALQRTSTGIHRDDFIFLLKSHELKKSGSQGQQKSFLVALKLAGFQLMEEEKKFKPLLLLDDIFDKLDDERIRKLMKLVSNGMFGQLIITDARQDRSRQILREAEVEAGIFTVENGNLHPHGE